jgi:proline dehydrogenase
MLLDDINNHQRLGIKLVRGAYYNEDKNTNLLYKTKKETDEAFSNAIDVIFDKKNNKNKSFICTHNKTDINKMIDLYTKNRELYNYNIYHASLYGFIERDTQRIVESGIKTFKYLPYGEMEDAVPYLLRRIYENPKVLYYFFR